ncbi:MAG: tyrosine-type recombinase/integrase [Armatimonadota bacterium]
MSAKPQTLATLIESYFKQRLIAQRHSSRETIASYRESLRLLAVFASECLHTAPEKLTIENLDREVVLAFLDYLEQTRCNCIRTRNSRLAAIRSFLKYVAYLDPTAMGVVQRVLAIPSKRTVKPILGYLTREELDVLLSVPDRNSRQGRRDYALLLFMARTGARVSEAVGVNASDLRLNHPCQVLLRGKGGKERVTPMKSDISDILNTLCGEMNIAPNTNAAVFVSMAGKRLTRHGVTHLMRRTVPIAVANMPILARKTITPHTLRHTTAMHLLQDGIDLNMIRSWLGHVSLDTTHQYVEADVEMKRCILEQCGVVEAGQMRYQPTDKLLALLESLC